MKISPQKLVAMMTEATRVAIAEAKKKAAKKAKPKKKSVDGEEVTDVPAGYKHDPNLDYARPQGRRSVIKAAGGANFGPFTGESLLRKLVADVIREQLAPRKIRGRQ